MSATMLNRRVDRQRVSLTKAILYFGKVVNLTIYINCYTSTRDNDFNPFDPLGQKTFHVHPSIHI
jgi:hypothetical protein